jgi:hypothetical protein
MAGLAERVAKAASASVLGAVPCKNMIVLSSVRYLVRCFFFEKTPYPRTFYVWASVVPLFSPMKNISLNYGKRLVVRPDGQPFVEIPEDAATFGKTLGSLLAERYLQQLLVIDSIEAFLQSFPFDDSNERPSTILDYGIANCLAGRFEAGMSLLEKVTRSPFVDMFSMQIKGLAAQRLTELNCSHSSFFEAVEICDRDNLAAHFPGVPASPAVQS